MKKEMIAASLHDEREAEYLYGALAATEEGVVGKLFADLAVESGRQACLWERALAGIQAATPPFHPGLRARLVSWLVHRLGGRQLLPVLAAMKVRGLSIYRDNPDLAAAEAAASAAGTHESWHRDSRGGGSLRAAVFGANDGLVSNASLILGVAGAMAEPRVVLMAGAAGLLAGGFSMAAGEYVSVRTQREMLEHQIELEKMELEAMPEEEIKELTLIYQARGLEKEAARALSRRLVEDPVQGLRTLAREELGLDPDTLASPVAAAVASFFSFAGGALIPLAPYVFGAGPGVLGASLLLTALALLVLGGCMSLFTGRDFWFSALRMMLIGLAAGAATYGLGRLFNVAIS
ncbi:MAG: VIT1/CCC1 transporter family protein [Acidobacteria bacterium]|nr:VIT1/CCC1 transporter family protein [Acidobacteriota bacterium]